MRLSDQNNSVPIPYRDSKLTRVLRPSLEGNTRIAIICNVSPSSEAFDETVSTLEFAKRAKKVVQNVTKNEPDSTKMLILRYENEILTLQNKLKQMEITVQVSGQDPHLKQEIGVIKEQLHTEMNEKNKLSEAFEVAMIEKTNLEAEIAKLKSCILVSENIPMRPLESSSQGGLSERRLNRLTFAREPVDEPVERVRTESIMASNQDDFFKKTVESPEQVKSLHKTFAELENFALEVPYSDFSVRDTMLLDKIDNFNELFESYNTRQSISLNPSTLRQSVQINPSLIRQSFAAFATEKANKEEDNLPTKDEMLFMLSEQDRIIETLHKEMLEKSEEIEILKDELSLCRTNMKAMQQRLREAKFK